MIQLHPEGMDMDVATIYWAWGQPPRTLAARDYLVAHQLPGIVRYYGCPAEEGGGGKVIMVKAGLFKNVDAALTWHPSGTPLRAFVFLIGDTGGDLSFFLERAPMRL